MSPFDKSVLLPVIVQDENTQQVLMLGYMNEEAFEKTISGDKICFFSRSKNRLWTKGETSGHFLFWSTYAWDCDEDTLLFKAQNSGPTCHKGTQSCFGNEQLDDFQMIRRIESTLAARREALPEGSYVAELIQKGTAKIAQKVGEEATEMVIESLLTENETAFLGESADLFFHYLLLLQQKGYRLSDVLEVLEKREK